MRELLIHCSQDQADAWSDAFFNVGALSVSIEDADFDTEHEQALFGEPGLEPEVQAWNQNRLVILLADEHDAAQIIAAAAADLGVDLSQSKWLVREVPDTDWVRLTQSQFGPIEVSDKIWIVPSWHKNDTDIPAADSDNIIRIELDPGLAFGTGSHPTTHLCLQWLAANLLPNATVLDYGCGSGILAIAACKLGAGSTDAVDIDPLAVQSTRANADNNQVELNALLPDDLGVEKYQLVIANILSNPLKLLAPMLSARVQPGGQLILSGVLERQAQEVAQAYAPWIDLDVYAALDGWVCLAGKKPL